MNETMTIQQARSLMRPELNHGVKCLCCGQRAQMYRRQLTSSMIMGLIILYNEARNKTIPEYHYMHLENFFKPLDVPSSVRGDIHKLRFWGFIEPADGDKEDGNPNNGFYRLTPKGIDFVNAKILVQKYVKIYNNTFYGFAGPEIDVHVAIKNKFNYTEMMGSTI